MRKTLKMVILISTILLSTGIALHAELSVDLSDDKTTTILMTIGEDPDPVGNIAWAPIRDIPTSQILNPTGDIREDGRPDIAYKSNSWPVVVWAYNAGTDFDIAFSEWNGAEWSAIEFLTGSLAEELDPRVFAETNGTIHVVWWEEGCPSSVYLLSRDPSGTWDATPTLVASEGRRPSVAVHEGILQIAFESDSIEASMNQDIVVARQEPDQSFFSEIVTHTTRIDRLDAILHVDNNRLWLEWKHTGESFQYAEASTEGWTEPLPEAWPDLSWIGVENVRRTIRRNLPEN